MFLIGTFFSTPATTPFWTKPVIMGAFFFFLILLTFKTFFHRSDTFDERAHQNFARAATVTLLIFVACLFFSMLLLAIVSFKLTLSLPVFAFVLAFLFFVHAVTFMFFENKGA